MAKFHDLKPEKQKAILLLTQQIVETGKKPKTFQQIADECGVDEKTLFRWRTDDKDFREARKELVDTYANEIITDAFVALRKQLRTKSNVKAAEVLLKSQGMLIDRKEGSPETVVNVEVMDRDNATLADELAHLRSKLSSLEQGDTSE